MTSKSDEIQWDTVSAPEQTKPQSKIVFDTVGDEFTGTYKGLREIPSQEGNYIQYIFEKDGDEFFTNSNYSMREGMAKVRRGSLVRLTFTDEMDTGQASLMKLFRVEVGRAPRPTTRTSANT